MKKVFLILSTILLFGTMAGCSVRSASGDDGMSEPAGDKGQTTNVADKETGGETSDPEMASAGELTSAEGTVNFPASELEEKLNQFPATIDFNFHFISNHETSLYCDQKICVILYDAIKLNNLVYKENGRSQTFYAELCHNRRV